MSAGETLPSVIDGDLEALTGDAGKFVRLAIALHEGPTLDDDSRRFLLAALNRYFNDDVPLETCFGISGSAGKRRVRTLLRYGQRNRQLSIAYRCLRMEACEENPSTRARCLVGEINRFETTEWRTWRDRSVPPEGTSELRAALFRAKKTGLALPSSEKQILRIMDMSGVFSCPADPATLPAVDKNEVQNGRQADTTKE